MNAIRRPSIPRRSRYPVPAKRLHFPLVTASAAPPTCGGGVTRHALNPNPE